MINLSGGKVRMVPRVKAPDGLDEHGVARVRCPYCGEVHAHPCSPAIDLMENHVAVRFAGCEKGEYVIVLPPRRAKQGDVT